MRPYLRPIFGLLLGILTYLFIRHHPDPLHEPLLTALFSMVAFSLIALQITLPSRRTALLGLRFLAGLSLILGYTTYHLLNTSTVETLIFIVPCSLSFFILFVFYSVAISEGRMHFPYSSLFREAWLVLLKTSFGKILVLLTWGLCLLASKLFGLLNISIVHDVIISQAFIFIVMPFVFGISMELLQHKEDVLTKFRDILLTFCRFLYPLYVVITLSFLWIIPFSTLHLADLWPTIYGVAFLHLFLFNGLYQGGLETPPYATWFCTLIYLFLITTLAYTTYSLQYPWAELTAAHLPERVLLFSSLLILVLYHLSYTTAIVFSKQRWLSLVSPSNTVISLGVAVFYLVLANLQ